MLVLKKVIFILLFSFFCIGGVFAGDIPESLMTGDQKALFIGTLSKNENECILNPKTIMMGNITNAPILVDCFDRYCGTQDKPKDGDIVVAVLNNDLTLNSWLFKATSTNYRTLKLVSERYNMAERYEKYINEGKYFEAWNKKVAEEQGEELLKAESKENNSSMYINIVIAILSLLGIVFVIKRSKII